MPTDISRLHSWLYITDSWKAYEPWSTHKPPASERWQVGRWLPAMRRRGRNRAEHVASFPTREQAEAYKLELENQTPSTK